MLRHSGALQKVETHQHAVRHCYRCDTVVEPRLSDQWFVKMEPLARPALQAVRDGAIRILPERWEAVYVNWLSNIRDWNISRQLWWGHRIPVWYCDDCDPPQNIIVSRDDITDVPLLRRPGAAGRGRARHVVLVVALADVDARVARRTVGRSRRVLSDRHARHRAGDSLLLGRAHDHGRLRVHGRAPFHTVYLHGTARDTQHRKMSKSLGNGIDPLDVIGLYGADALRWTLIAGMGMGTDVILDPNDIDKSFATGRNFGRSCGTSDASCSTASDRTRFGRWRRSTGSSLTRADDGFSRDSTRRSPIVTARSVRCVRPSPMIRRRSRWRDNERYAGLRLNEYAESARRFVWNELADWYLESVKGRLLDVPGDDREVARAVLVHAFDSALRLLHPIVPFVTESLWQRLPGRGDGEFLARAPWPVATKRDDIARRR